MRLHALIAGLALAGVVVDVAAAAQVDATTELMQRLRTEQVVRGTFTQKRQIQGFKRPVESTGDFVVAKGRGILWHTRTPFDSMLAMSPDRLRVASPGRQAEVDLDAKREPLLRTLNGLLQSVVIGDVAALKQQFDLDIRLTSGDAWEIGLAPRDAAIARRFSRILLTGAAYVHEVRLTERGGDLTTVTLAGQKGDTRLTDDESKQLQ